MIDQKTIYQIAQLARLKINENEAIHYAEQLDKVLNHFQEISHLDTAQIEPLITPIDLVLNLREDEIRQELSTEELLKNAPDRMGQLFKVPPVI